MKLIICLDKEDIHTKLCGHHYIIETNGVSISFTPEAAQEFINDVQGIQDILAKHPENEHHNCTCQTSPPPPSKPSAAWSPSAGTSTPTSDSQKDSDETHSKPS